MNFVLCILGYMIVCNGVAHDSDPWQIILGAVLAILTGFKELNDTAPPKPRRKASR